MTPFLKEIAWRFEALKSLIINKKPLITKETANSAMTNRMFSTKKIENTLDFKFTDINLTIKKYTEWFIADQA